MQRLADTKTRIGQCQTQAPEAVIKKLAVAGYPYHLTFFQEASVN